MEWFKKYKIRDTRTDLQLREQLRHLTEFPFNDAQTPTKI